MASNVGCELGDRIRGNIVYMGFFGPKNFEKEATKDQQQDNLGVFILATVAKVAAAEAFTQADDRSWYSLPKQIMVQKNATPKDGKISIRSGSSSETSFEVDPTNQTNFVYLKSIRRGNPIKVLSSFGFEQGLAEFHHPEIHKIFAANL